MPTCGLGYWMPGESKESKRDRARKWAAKLNRGGRRKKSKRGGR